MNGKKRHRPGSMSTSPSSASRRSLRTTPSAQSTSIHQSRFVQFGQQRPIRRVESNTLSQNFGSETPFSWNNRATNHSHAQSTPPSAADIDPEDDTIIKEREDADYLNEVIMCTDMRDRGTVGCCYYLARDQKLYVMADITYGGVETIKTCEQYWSPILFYIAEQKK